MIRFLCPGCQKTLGVEDSRANSIGSCPNCKTRFQVPAAPAPEPPPPPPPQPIVVRPFLSQNSAPPPPPFEPSNRKSYRDDDDYDDDRPRRKSRRYDEEDEYDDRPRSRKSRKKEDDWEAVDVDEEEEERPRRKKKKKRGRKREAAGLFGEHDMFSVFLGGFAGLSLFFIVVSFLFPPAIFLTMGLAYLVAFAAGIWMIVLAFQDSVAAGLMYLFVPFYSLFYLIMNFDYLKKPFYAAMLSFLILLMCLGMMLILFKGLQ